MGDVGDRLAGEDGMLAVDEDEVVAARLGDARDIAGARQADVHSERHLAGLHHLFQGIRQDRRVGNQGAPLFGLIRYFSPVACLL